MEINLDLILVHQDMLFPIEDYYNYIELKAQYKNYIVTNKYIRNSDTYVLELMNPFSKKTKEVYVRDYLYYNTYFVGDTIK